MAKEQPRWADYDSQEEEDQAPIAKPTLPPPTTGANDDEGFQEVGGNKKRRKELPPQAPKGRGGGRGRGRSNGKDADHKGRGRGRGSAAPRPKGKGKTPKPATNGSATSSKPAHSNGHAAPVVVAATTTASTPATPTPVVPLVASKPVAAGVSWLRVAGTNLPPAPASATAAAVTTPQGTTAPTPSVGGTTTTTTTTTTSTAATPIDTTKELLDSFSAIKISHTPVAIVPRGLVNRGNTCFLNTVLQALLSLPPFYTLFASLQSKRFSMPTPFIDACVRFVQQFDIAKDPKPAAGAATPTTPGGSNTTRVPSYTSPILPEDFFPLLASFNTKTTNSQEDAHEFLNFLLDRLHEELCAAVPEPKGDGSASASAGEDDYYAGEKKDDDEEGWLEVGRNNQAATVTKATFRESPISQIFGSILRSKLSKQGARPSVSLSPIYAVPLDIDVPGINTLEEALSFFMAPEHLDGVTVRTMEVRAKKQTTFDRLQPVFIFHLKRFAYAAGRGKSGGAQKVSKPITFPKKLYLRSNTLYRPGATGGKEYVLQAVVAHHGKLPTGGHYTCDAWSPRGARWVHYDDTDLGYVQPKVVFEREAYMLFYVASGAE